MINTRICFLVAARRGGWPFGCGTGPGVATHSRGVCIICLFEEHYFIIFIKGHGLFTTFKVQILGFCCFCSMPQLWFVSHLQFGFLHYTVQDHLACGRFRYVSMISTKTGLSSTPTDQREIKRNRGHICRTLKEKPNQN